MWLRARGQGDWGVSSEHRELAGEAGEQAVAGEGQSGHRMPS